MLLPYFPLGGKNSISYFWHLSVRTTVQKMAAVVFWGVLVLLWFDLGFFFFFSLANRNHAGPENIHFNTHFFPERQTLCSSLDLMTESFIPVINSSFHSWFKESRFWFKESWFKAIRFLEKTWNNIELSHAKSQFMLRSCL